MALELGGNALFIVFDAADLDAVAVGATASKYRNAGQPCVRVNRFFVHETAYEEFARRLAALRVGNGMSSLVNGAIAEGAKLVCGGDVAEQGGNFYPPTLLTDVAQQMPIASDEIFGSVATLIPFRTDEEVIRMANDTPYGLAAYFYSRDIGRV